MGKIRIHSGAALTGIFAVLCFSACGEKGDNQEGGGKEPSMTDAVTQDWPIFRGNAELQGISGEDLLPPLKMAWSFEPKMPKGKKRRPGFEASPVISGGSVYVGSEGGEFYSIDLDSGKLNWTFHTEGPVIAPAAVFDGKVFFGDTYGFVYALETGGGTELWRFEADGKIEGGINALKSESGEMQIFVGSHDYFLYCLKAEDGSVLWKNETGNLVITTPSIVDSAGQKAIMFGACDGMLHIIPADGKGEPREVEIGTYVGNSSPVRDGICYVADNDGGITAIEVASGETVWKLETDAQYIASAAVGEKRLFVAGGDKRLVAYDRMTGDEIWAFQSTRALDSSPVVCPGAIWQGGLDGRLYAVDPETGKELWNYDLGAKIKASPALSRKTLVICGKNGLVYGFRK